MAAAGAAAAAAATAAEQPARPEPGSPLLRKIDAFGEELVRVGADEADMTDAGFVLRTSQLTGGRDLNFEKLLKYERQQLTGVLDSSHPAPEEYSGDAGRAAAQRFGWRGQEVRSPVPNCFGDHPILVARSTGILRYYVSIIDEDLYDELDTLRREYWEPAAPPLPHFDEDETCSWKILALDKGAHAPEIDRAHKALIRTWAPDRNSAAPGWAAEKINAAWEELKGTHEEAAEPLAPKAAKAPEAAAHPRGPRNYSRILQICFVKYFMKYIEANKTTPKTAQKEWKTGGMKEIVDKAVEQANRTEAKIGADAYGKVNATNPRVQDSNIPSAHLSRVPATISRSP